jgi:hypothetical protein
MMKNSKFPHNEVLLHLDVIFVMILPPLLYTSPLSDFLDTKKKLN